MSNAIQSLWQHQEPELSRMSTGEFRQRADQALSDDHRHRLTGPVTAGILISCFIAFGWGTPTAIGRIGSAVGISAGLSLVCRAYRLTKNRPLLPIACGIDAYRRILLREEAALTICWQTMLLVQLGVGLLLFGEPGRNARRVVTAFATVAPVILVAGLTRAKAQAYGRRARELDRKQ